MASAETEVIARIRATGFNRHVRDHGPDGDYAGEATETGDGHGLVVTRDGVQYGIRVERLKPLGAAGPLTPGQCWAAVRQHLELQVEHDLRAYEAADAAGEAATAAARGLLVAANRATLAKMRELEATGGQ
jgi:hypothetical protein